eukprot:8354397-Alexandrium_andersonii.AAC.1
MVANRGRWRTESWRDLDRASGCCRRLDGPSTCPHMGGSEAVGPPACPPGLGWRRQRLQRPAGPPFPPIR